jgi:ZIP family zinc transporter
MLRALNQGDRTDKAFELVALLYLVTEELLVKAHETADTPLITAVFFVGFFLLILTEEMIGG